MTSKRRHPWSVWKEAQFNCLPTSSRSSANAERYTAATRATQVSWPAAVPPIWGARAGRHTHPPRAQLKTVLTCSPQITPAQPGSAAQRTIDVGDARAVVVEAEAVGALKVAGVARGLRWAASERQQGVSIMRHQACRQLGRTQDAAGGRRQRARGGSGSRRQRAHGGSGSRRMGAAAAAVGSSHVGAAAAVGSVRIGAAAAVGSARAGAAAAQQLASACLPTLWWWYSPRLVALRTVGGRHVGSLGGFRAGVQHGRVQRNLAA